MYDNCDDLVAGMEKVAQRISKNDTQLKKYACVIFLFVVSFGISLHKKLKKIMCFVLVCCFDLFALYRY